MEQNIFDYLVEGLDLNAFYSFIDSKTDIEKIRQYLFFNTLHGLLYSMALYVPMKKTTRKFTYFQQTANI